MNGEKVNLPMKLGDGGEAFFVFETEGMVPSELLTSPVISPTSSPRGSESPPPFPEPDFLDLSRTRSRSSSPERDQAILNEPPSTPPPLTYPASASPYASSRNDWADSFPTLARQSSPPPLTKEQIIERARLLSRKLTDINIPAKITDNGDVVLDITGYKSDETDIEQSEEVVRKILMEEFGEDNLEQLMSRDDEGNLRIFGQSDEAGYTSDDMFTRSDLYSSSIKGSPSASSTYAASQDTKDQLHGGEKSYAKTLRLTSDQLKMLNLNSGANDISFSVNQGRAVCNAKVFYWQHNVPIVISDIDGTITKSDALGHVLAMIGRDWTHPGVGKLFTDIASNGYNIMYLTARSVGQADSTRYYLQGIQQNGFKLPDGPVILSPERTMAALRREVIMRKPEVFKMACLRDIKILYGELEETPFYAGFGNRITDALSYRSVGVPSSRIFTINSIGDVHMELLELAGYKSSYVHIADLVDHFFPPVKSSFRGEETYTDLNFWREPIADLSEWETDEDSVHDGTTPATTTGKGNDMLPGGPGSSSTSNSVGTVSTPRPSTPGGSGTPGVDMARSPRRKDTKFVQKVEGEASFSTSAGTEPAPISSIESNSQFFATTKAGTGLPLGQLGHIEDYLEEEPDYGDDEDDEDYEDDDDYDEDALEEDEDEDEYESDEGYEDEEEYEEDEEEYEEYDESSQEDRKELVGDESAAAQQVIVKASEILQGLNLNENSTSGLI